MIGKVDISVHAESPQIRLSDLITFKNSPSSVTVFNVPEQEGKWKISVVTVSVRYPDNTVKYKNCTKVNGKYIATIDGCNLKGYVKGGYVISGSGTDENGRVFYGIVLGVGDVRVIDEGDVL